MSTRLLLDPLLPDDGSTVSWSNLHGAALGLAIAEASCKHKGLVIVVMEDPR